MLNRRLRISGAAGGLTADAHLAALAMEHQCELHSNDPGFARFPGLPWLSVTAKLLTLDAACGSVIPA